MTGERKAGTTMKTNMTETMQALDTLYNCAFGRDAKVCLLNYYLHPVVDEEAPYCSLR